MSAPEPRPIPPVADLAARLQAAQARLAGAGYGAAVPHAFAAAARLVSERLGAEAAIELARDASLIVIRTRASVGVLFLETAAAVSLRLGAADFRRWTGLIRGMLRSAPESVQPFLANSGKLVDRLEIGALEAWVQSGLRLAGGVAATRLAYFRLEHPEARLLLARYAGEHGFRTLEPALRRLHLALWGALPPMVEIPQDGWGDATQRVTFADGVIALPPAYPGFRGEEARVYHAALAHAGAHFAFGQGKFPLGQLKPMHVAVISLIEDARVEALAIDRMPGLARLWRPFHRAEADGIDTAPNLFAQLARALIEPDFVTGKAWVNKGRRMFAACRHRLSDPAISREIGNVLANDLGQIRVQFDPRNYLVQPVYRDDNQGLWDLPDAPDHPPEEIEAAIEPPKGSTNGGVAESVAPITEAEEDGLEIAKLAEYDHAAGIERADWVIARAYLPASGDIRFWEKLEDRHAALLARLRAVLGRHAMGERRRLRRQPDGERLDLDAALDGAISRRSGRVPDHRIYERTAPPSRSIAVHLLVDLSQSTADRLADGATILELERDAVAILARTLDQMGDAFAITGFSSAGREDLRITRIKTFDEPLSQKTGMIISGVVSGHSTRIGAAMRLAGLEISRIDRHRKLLLVLTDGEPSDVDVPDPDYLIADANMVIRKLRKSNVDAVCFSLGNQKQNWLGRVFDRGRVHSIEKVEQIPERLSAVYMRITA